MDYKPAPRDTSGVRLPSQIADLTELLARNTHENWARRRMSELIQSTIFFALIALVPSGFVFALFRGARK